MKLVLALMTLAFTIQTFAQSDFSCEGDRLLLPNGEVSHVFNWDYQCEEALVQLGHSHTGLFCDDNAMFQVQLGYLLGHSFSSHCREALVEAREHKGLFCQNGQMMNQWGRLIKDYNFRSSCQKALGKLIFSEVHPRSY